MLKPIDDESQKRPREFKITKADDPLYILTALTVLIPGEEATVCASKEQFKTDHREVVEWAEYDLAHLQWLEEVKELKRERAEEGPRRSIDEDDEFWPAPPISPSCARPSAEYKTSFADRMAKFKGDREFLDECKKRARERLAAQVHPDLYIKGELGGVDHNAFCGHLGKRGRSE